MTMQFRIYCTKSSTRWFKVTLSSPSWRSLNLSKRSLNHPKKGTAWITRYMLCHTAQSIWVFPKIGVPPISHPKMIIFSRKTHGFVGETHHFRKPPYCIMLNCYMTKNPPLIGSIIISVFYDSIFIIDFRNSNGYLGGALFTSSVCDFGSWYQPVV